MLPSTLGIPEQNSRCPTRTNLSNSRSSHLQRFYMIEVHVYVAQNMDELSWLQIANLTAKETSHWKKRVAPRKKGNAAERVSLSACVWRILWHPFNARRINPMSTQFNPTWDQSAIIIHLIHIGVERPHIPVLNPRS